MKPESYLTVLSLAGLVAGAIGGIFSQLTKESVEIAGTSRKLLTPAGKIALAISVLGFVGSFTSELLKSSIQAQQALQATLDKRLAEQRYWEEKEWRKRSSQLENQILAKTKSALNSSSENLQRTIRGFQREQSETLNTRLDIAQSRQTILRDSLLHQASLQRSVLRAKFNILANSNSKALWLAKKADATLSEIQRSLALLDNPWFYFRITDNCQDDKPLRSYCDAYQHTFAELQRNERIDIKTISPGLKVTFFLALYKNLAATSSGLERELPQLLRNRRPDLLYAVVLSTQDGSLSTAAVCNGCAERSLVLDNFDNLGRPGDAQTVFVVENRGTIRSLLDLRNSLMAVAVEASNASIGGPMLNHFTATNVGIRLKDGEGVRTDRLARVTLYGSQTAYWYQFTEAPPSFDLF